MLSHSDRGFVLTKLTIAFTSVCAALALAGSASAALSVGVTEDGGKTTIDAGAAFFTTLNDVGIVQNQVSIPWSTAAPSAIANKEAVDAWLPVAQAHSIKVVFNVSWTKPKDIVASPTATAQFAAFLQQLARTYPTVRDYVVGNEPNLSYFWQPQFNRNGTGASGPGYEAVLAQSYDALKTVDPGLDVIGVGLSPRGRDNPRAATNQTTSPVRFLRDLAAAYRKSGRKAPIMDALAFHPYPNLNTDTLTTGYRWPNAGVADLERIKQAIWDGFHGTHQPTFAEPGRKQSHPLVLHLDETGWQTEVPPAYQTLYTGKENVPTITEETQAQIYGDLVRMMSCDVDVASLDFFHMIDETNLIRWQSGLLRVDGSLKPSYDAVKAAIAETKAGCPFSPTRWRHVSTVIGSKVAFRSAKPPAARSLWTTAEEEAMYRAGILRLSSSKRLGANGLKRLAGLLSRANAPQLALKTGGKLKAYESRTIRFPRKTLKNGYYVYGLRLAATMNPGRTKLYVSKPFRVGPATPAKKKARKRK
jgi:hypothetical protein